MRPAPPPQGWLERLERLMDNAIVVCVRVADQEVPVPGSVTERCQRCGEDVWISKASSESVGTAPAWCMQCLHATLVERS